MRAPLSGERKLTELDYVRLRKFTAAGAFPQLAEILNDAQFLPPHTIPLDVVTLYARFVVRDLKMVQIEGNPFQPEATGDFVT